jgi:hypothetical protein
MTRVSLSAKPDPEYCRPQPMTVMRVAEASARSIARVGTALRARFPVSPTVPLHRPANDHGKFLPHPAQREVLVVAGPPGRAHIRGIHEFTEAALQTVPEGRASHNLLCEGVLRRDEAPDLSRHPIFHPTVGIRNELPVEGIHHHRDTGLGEVTLGRTRRSHEKGEKGGDNGMEGVTLHGASRWSSGRREPEALPGQQKGSNVGTNPIPKICY